MCLGATFSEDGIKCVQMEHCVKGRPGLSVHNCYGCEAGYGLTFQRCYPCTGNTYSDDGLTCKQGPPNCAGTDNHTEYSCTVCDKQYDLIQGVCVYHTPPPYMLIIACVVVGIGLAAVIVAKFVFKKDIRQSIEMVPRNAKYLFSSKKQQNNE